MSRTPIPPQQRVRCACGVSHEYVETARACPANRTSSGLNGVNNVEISNVGNSFSSGADAFTDDYDDYDDEFASVVDEMGTNNNGYVVSPEQLQQEAKVEIKSLYNRVQQAVKENNTSELLQTFKDAGNSQNYVNALATMDDMQKNKNWSGRKDIDKNVVNRYRAMTAYAGYAYMKTSGKIDDSIDLSGKNIGNATSDGYAESNTHEWHMMRYLGMGGSDLNGILNSHNNAFDKNGAPLQNTPEYGGGTRTFPNNYYAKNVDRILHSKIDPPTEEYSAGTFKNHSPDSDAPDWSSPFTQGNALEDITAHLASEKTGKKIGHTKHTYVDGSGMRVNFDYLVVDNDGNPTESLEIKTTGKINKYGDPQHGIDALPYDVRAQALEQCVMGGFKKGNLAVLEGGRNLKVISWDMTPELEQEAQRNRQRAKKFYAAAQSLRDVPKDQRASMITDEFLNNAGVNVRAYRKSQEAMNKWNNR